MAISPCFVSRIFTGQIESRVRVGRQIARHHTLPRLTALQPEIDWPGPYDVAVSRLISSSIAIRGAAAHGTCSTLVRVAIRHPLSLPRRHQQINKQQGKTDICAFSLPPRLTPALRQWLSAQSRDQPSCEHLSANFGELSHDQDARCDVNGYYLVVRRSVVPCFYTPCQLTSITSCHG